MEWTQVAQVVSSGGVLAFAGLVYVQLRAFLGELEKHRLEEEQSRLKLTEVLTILGKLVDHERDREMRRVIRDELSDALTPPEGVHR